MRHAVSGTRALAAVALFAATTACSAPERLPDGGAPPDSDGILPDSGSIARDAAEPARDAGPCVAACDACGLGYCGWPHVGDGSGHCAAPDRAACIESAPDCDALRRCVMGPLPINHLYTVPVDGQTNVGPAPIELRLDWGRMLRADEQPDAWPARTSLRDVADDRAIELHVSSSDGDFAASAGRGTVFLAPAATLAEGVYELSIDAESDFQLGVLPGRVDGSRLTIRFRVGSYPSLHTVFSCVSPTRSTVRLSPSEPISDPTPPDVHVGSTRCELAAAGDELSYACPWSGSAAPVRIDPFGPDATGAGGSPMRGPASDAPLEIAHAEMTDLGSGCYAHRVPRSW